MKIKLFQIDAFATGAFEGNPAAICPLDCWLDDGTMQRIAEENNLSETAFLVPTDRGFQLRWFTPVAEVDLCGHATLAAAYVLFEHLGHTQPAIIFETRSGDLTVERQGELLAMDFPSQPPTPCATPAALVAGLGHQPVEVLRGDDYLAVFEDEAIIHAINPDHSQLSQLDLRGVMVTAPGRDVDFVSRFFAPKYGIPEDPVTGSAHCAMTPYWAERLGKNMLTAKQVSKRTGSLICELKGDRVMLAGRAVTFLEGEISF